jgi:hypothetical protein
VATCCSPLVRKVRKMFTVFDVYDEDYVAGYVSCDNCPHRKACHEQCEEAVRRQEEGKPSQYHGTAEQ